MALCYCKTPINVGDRRIVVVFTVDWGDDDERENQPGKAAAFCSFKCVSDWSTDRAREHDGHVVTSPDESHEDREVVVDTATDKLIREA